MTDCVVFTTYLYCVTNTVRAIFTYFDQFLVIFMDLKCGLKYHRAYPVMQEWPNNGKVTPYLCNGIAKTNNTVP
jgi:hypothetical protein